MKRKEIIAQYETVRDRLETSLHYREQALKHALAGDLPSQKPFTGQAQGARDLLKQAIRKANRNVSFAKVGLRKGNTGGAEMLYLQFLMEVETEIVKNPVMGSDYHDGQINFIHRLQQTQKDKISRMS